MDPQLADDIAYMFPGRDYTDQNQRLSYRFFQAFDGASEGALVLPFGKHSNQVQVPRGSPGLLATVYIEFFVDSFDVRLHGVDRNVQLLSHL